MKLRTMARRAALALLCAPRLLHAQNFASPEVWTSEDFTDQRIATPLSQPGHDFAWTSPSDPHTAIGNNYKDMIYALPGNFNGAVNTYNGVATPVVSVAFLFGIDDPATPVNPNDRYLAVYTLESRGYHAGSVLKNYGDPSIVNLQEGLSLYNQGGHLAYTYHPTIWRFDKSVLPILTDHIKAAVSGDFNGDQQDEIALFVKDGTDQSIIVLQCHNYFGEALNYQMAASTVMTVPVATMDFDRIKFASAGKYTEQNSKIAVLYDNPNGQQEIYTFERGGPWSMTLQYSQPTTTFDLAMVHFVASGRFESGSPTPRLAICYTDPATNTDKVLVSHDNGPSWSLNERFSRSRSQFDFDNVRSVVAGSFDGVASDDELAFFYDHGDDPTGIGSLQQLLVTTHGAPWGTTVAINEKRSAMDYDLIRHAYAGNLDYNAGSPRDEIGVVYNDREGTNDGQRFKTEKVFVYINRPPFSGNDFMLDANVQPFDEQGDPVGAPDYRPFFPLGWFGVPYDDIEAVRARAQGVYNTLWLGAMVPHPSTPAVEIFERNYQDHALHLGFHTIQEARMEVYSPAGIAAIVGNRNPNSVLAWCTTDEPDEVKVDPADLADHNDVIANAGAHPPLFMPVMNNENASEFYRDQSEVVSLDGYPYYPGNNFDTAPVLAPLRSALIPHRAMQSAIRYNKPAFIFVPQGTPVVGGNHAGPDRIPTFEEIRYNSLAPVIEGARGLLYYAYDDARNVDDVRRRVDLVSEELSHYIPALGTQSLAGRVTIDRHGFVPADYDKVADHLDQPNPIRVDYTGGWSRYMSLFSYALHEDPGTGRYYLFVANNWTLPVDNVELTAFGVPGKVSLLPAEYFQNGHYVPMDARVDAGGDYVTFHDSFKGNEVKVYAIGDLPAIVPPADQTVQQFEGDLSFSNQRKLAAAPVTTEVNGGVVHYSDDIRYHLVYHRLDPRSGKMKVYYRRSKLTKRDTPTETAEWEPWEMCLSDDIVDANESSLTSISCAHPAIVVRYDLESHQNKAYVVFDCQGGPEAPNGYVVESILAADASYTPPVAGPRAHAIATHTGRSLDNWGTPMINASSNGNYYVWADSLYGIKAGWKRPQDTRLRGITEIHWNASGFSAQHPSLNSYSHIGDREDNCALVWQEWAEGGAPNIYYSRLRGDDNNGIAPYLPALPVQRITLARNTANTIVRVNDPSPDAISYNRMPTVFRCEELGQAGNTPGSGDQLTDLDRIYWEAALVPTGNVSTLPKWMRYGLIAHRALDINDEWSGTRWEPSYWEGWPARWIWSSQGDLSEPNVAQGTTDDGGGAPTFTSDRAVNLDFTSTGLLSHATSIWHVPHGYFSVTRAATSYSGINVALLSHAEEIGGPAHAPQLASQPFVASPSDWFRNQRVFNSGTANSIVASRSYFVKAALADLKACPLVGFEGASGPSLVTPFLVDGAPVPFALPRWDSAGTNPPDPGDTVRTGWFTVGSRQDLSFALLGATVTGGIGGGGSVRTEIWIERKLTGARLRLSLPSGSDIDAVPVTFSLVNGADEEYRLLVINRDNAAHYTEHLALDGMPMLDSAYADSSALSKGPVRSGLDLGMLRGDVTPGGATLAVYPNPVTDRVMVTLAGAPASVQGGKVTLTVASALGTVVERRRIEMLRGVELEVGGWADGVYFVSVDAGAGPIATASFVVRR